MLSFSLKKRENNTEPTRGHFRVNQTYRCKRGPQITFSTSLLRNQGLLTRQHRMSLQPQPGEHSPGIVRKEQKGGYGVTWLRSFLPHRHQSLLLTTSRMTGWYQVQKHRAGKLIESTILNPLPIDKYRSTGGGGGRKIK